MYTAETIDDIFSAAQLKAGIMRINELHESKTNPDYNPLDNKYNLNLDKKQKPNDTVSRILTALSPMVSPTHIIAGNLDANIQNTISNKFTEYDSGNATNISAAYNALAYPIAVAAITGSQELTALSLCYAALEGFARVFSAKQDKGFASLPGKVASVVYNAGKSMKDYLTKEKSPNSLETFK